MSLYIQTFILGLLQNNTYLIADPTSQEAVIIDPSFEVDPVLEQAKQLNYQITQLWITHAHFDHVAGVCQAVTGRGQPAIALHPDDLPLWRQQGGASLFGFNLGQLPEPAIRLQHNQYLPIGQQRLQVRHTPGHTLGHVVFYSLESRVAFCGDLIFQGSVGRTDLPGADQATLLQSIRSQILTLPGDTRLLCGHGPETTVQAEKNENPFLYP